MQGRILPISFDKETPLDSSRRVAFPNTFDEKSAVKLKATIKRIMEEEHKTRHSRQRGPGSGDQQSENPIGPENSFRDRFTRLIRICR